MSDLNIKHIFRCAYPDESTHLGKGDIALILDDNTSQIPEGYGLYLISEDNRMRGINKLRHIPENCVSGSFVYADDSGAVRLLGTSDIPDRTLFLTGLCNSNCIMCPYSEGYRLQSHLEPPELIKRYIDLMDPNADYVCITGGEPTLLREGFLDIISQVNRHFHNVVLHILTNGRTFAYKQFVNEYRKVRPYKTLLGIPLHADNAELHDTISQSKGSFDQTIRGLDNLYVSDEYIEIRIVTSNLNYKNLPELARFIVSRYPFCHHVCLMGMEMMGNAMINRDIVWCSYETIYPYIREATDIMLSGGVETKLYNYPLCMIEKRYWPLYRKSITQSKIVFLPDCEGCKNQNECGGFFRTTSIMPNIKVTPIKEI